MVIRLEGSMVRVGEKPHKKQRGQRSAAQKG